MAENNATQTQRNVYDIRQFLSGLKYPIERGELIDAATEEGLDTFIIEKMQALPNERFDNEDDLSLALGEAEMF